MRPTKQALLNVEHLTLAEQGKKFAVDPRTISRWRRHYGLADPSQFARITPEQEERVSVLVAEEMPFIYVTLDTGVSDTALRERYARSPGAAEWKRTWPAIFNNDELLKLHREFFPTPPRSKKDRVKHDS